MDGWSRWITICPPSVTTLYELQQDYVSKIMMTEKEKQQKRLQERERKKETR